MGKGSPAAGVEANPGAQTTSRLRLGTRLQAKLGEGSVAPAPVNGSSVKMIRAPRRARLHLTRIDPWSVLRTSFLLSVALGVVVFVAVVIVWGVLTAAGLWDSINGALAPLLSSETGPDFDITDYVGMGRVVGFTLVVAVLDVILLTSIATLGAFLYNLSAVLLGGVEVTLTEER